MAGANIGMMDGAYFVGRNEILSWVNTTLHLNLSKVEEVNSSLQIMECYQKIPQIYWNLMGFVINC